MQYVEQHAACRRFMRFKLLNTLVIKEGELSKNDSTSKHYKAHLRLATTTHLLKLSYN